MPSSSEQSREYSYRGDGVLCIRCDQEVQDVKMLHYNHSKGTLYICSTCFEEVENRAE